MERIDLIIEEYGLKLGKRSERLVVRRGEEVVWERPLEQVRSVTMSARGVSISSDLLAALAAHQIALGVVDELGNAAARLSGVEVTGEAATRRAQLLGARQASCAAPLARWLIAEKLRSQVRLLRYLERRVEEEASDYAASVEGIITQGKALMCVGLPDDDEALDATLDVMMGHEGQAARLYWRAFGATLSPQQLPRREKRGASDAVNGALNYGYAILREQVWGMVERAHMDPYAGVLHRDRAGRPGMVLDLMEPWRVVVEDAVGGVCRRSKQEWEGGLSDEVKRQVAREVLGRLNAPASFGARRARVAACMQQSVREVGAYMRGECAEPTLFRWDVRGPKRAEQREDPLERFFRRPERKR